MIKEAINRILDLAKPVLVEANGGEYSTQGLTPVKHPDLSLVQVRTLTGLVDHLMTELLVDSDHCWLKGDWFVLVEDHASVKVLSAPVNGFNQRLELAHARAPEFGFPFGHFMGLEEFIIGLQSQFIPTPVRDGVLKIVGNVRGDQVQTVKDDGIGQRVEVAAGVATVEKVELPNPVTLKPWRTFREIDQVESKFVLRMRAGQGGPMAALIEADGGSWKNEAALKIAEWLQGRLPDEVAVLA